MWHRFLKWLVSISFVAFLIRHSKRISLPGFEKIPIYDVTRFFWLGIKKGALTMRASALAFNFFLALFPTIIFIFTLIPYIPIAGFQEQLMSLLHSVMPLNAYKATEETILDIVTNQRGGLLSIGFISALYFSTNGFNALISAFNSTYHDFETRTWYQQRMVSVLLVFISTLLMVIAIGLIIYSENLRTITFKDNEFVYYLIQGGRWFLLFGLFYALISCTFYLGPARKSGWKFASAGSMLATVLSILMSVGFAYYVNNFGNYNKLYGSIGTLIVVLLWIYFNAVVVLVGFDLNVSIREAKKNKAGAINPHSA